MSLKAGKCSICERSLGNENKREVTTSCNHTFHHTCAEQQLVKAKSNDCPKCQKKSALQHALTGSTANTDKHHDSTQNKITKNTDKAGYGSSSASTMAASNTDESYYQTSQVTKHQASHHHSKTSPEGNDENHTKTNNQQWNKQETDEWECDKCEYINRSSNTVCKTCKQPRQSENNYGNAPRQSNRMIPPDHHSSNLPSKSVPKVYPALHDESDSSSESASSKQPLPKATSKKGSPSSESAHASNPKSKPSTSSSASLPVQYQVPVYISDLSLDTDEIN